MQHRFPLIKNLQAESFSNMKKEMNKLKQGPDRQCNQRQDCLAARIVPRRRHANVRKTHPFFTSTEREEKSFCLQMIPGTVVV